MYLWQTLTGMGALSLTGPSAMAIALWLALGRSWRLAGYWCALFLAGMAGVVVTKVAFIGWGIGLPALDFAGFSGHAMRAAAVLPLAFFLALQNASVSARKTGVIVGVSCAVLISVSRVVVGAHSVSEAVLGCALGLGVALAFMWRARGEQFHVLHPLLIAASMSAIFLMPKADTSPATQQSMVELALYLSGHERPFVRESWKMASPGT
jgi:membrane-associated phospholipid phosphatase